MVLTRRLSHYLPNNFEDWSSRLVTRMLHLRPSKSPLPLSSAMLLTANSSLELQSRQIFRRLVCIVPSGRSLEPDPASCKARWRFLRLPLFSGSWYFLLRVVPARAQVAVPSSRHAFALSTRLITSWPSGSGLHQPTLLCVSTLFKFSSRTSYSIRPCPACPRPPQHVLSAC